MIRLLAALRPWMLAPMVLVLGVLHVATGLPGLWWLFAYGAGFAFFAMVMFSMLAREGKVMRDRSEFQHGLDMHGHYGGS